MASIQTQVFENNQWTTRFLNPEDVFRQDNRPRPNPTGPKIPKPPPYGLLTKTVIPSPITRWILPAQLRAPQFNDVALVGNRSVSICELDSDNQLQPIATKDFDANIHCCEVMGPHGYLTYWYPERNASGDVEMADAAAPDSRPAFQQLLVLVLETGELILTFLEHTSNGEWQFVTLPSINLRSADLDLLNTHELKLADIKIGPFEPLKISFSPNWEYLALSFTEDRFLLCHLKPLDMIRHAYNQGRLIKPHRQRVVISARGTIQTVNFLYPGPGKESHVILVVIVTHSGISRLATFEWDTSETFGSFLRKDEVSGHRLEETYRFPLLIIPLTVGPLFVIVTENATAVCSDFLSGPPTFAPFSLGEREENSTHYGTRTPLWTAWARPGRHQNYHGEKDAIYLAREDGWLYLLEIADESGPEQTVSMGPVSCNIAEAFACLACRDGDVVISGGDIGPVSIWLVKPRGTAHRIGAQENWSFSTDLVLLSEKSNLSGREKHRPPEESSWPEHRNDLLSAPSRVFACGGKGAHGAVTELRYGIEARIGLDLLYSSPIKRCWTFPDIEGTQGEGFLMLLALPDSSALLHISHDFSEVSERGLNTVSYDLLSTTLAVHITADLVIQITNMYATIITSTACYQHLISDLIQDPRATMTNAAITGNTLALASYSFSSCKLLVFRFNGASFTSEVVFDVEGEITSLSVHEQSEETYVLAGLWDKNCPTLRIFPTRKIQTAAPIDLHRLEASGGARRAGDGPITSIVSSVDDAQRASIMLGTRNGVVLRVYGDLSRPSMCRVSRNPFGLSSSDVFGGPMLQNTALTFICNDSGLAVVQSIARARPEQDEVEAIHRVWLTDALQRSMPSPIVNSVSTLWEEMENERPTVAMISGARILITELQPKPTAVPRPLPMEGHPLKMVYAERLESLVTVLSKDGVHSLHFIDPSTGNDLSRPMKMKPARDGFMDTDYIDHLGVGARVVALLNWRPSSETKSIFCIGIAKPGSTGGQILLVRAQEDTNGTEIGNRRRIRFYVHTNKKLRHGPLRAVTVAEDGGIFASVGDSVEYYRVQQNIGAPIKGQLQSPAIAMGVVPGHRQGEEVVHGHLQVATARHSLVVFDYSSKTAVASQTMSQLQTDVFGRRGFGMSVVDLNSTTEEERQKERHTITLVSDTSAFVYGLYVSSRAGEALEPMFEAPLAASIRKFVQGKTRPRWATRLPCSKRLQNRLEENDVLGLAVDGSLVHFSVLSEDTWRLLKYIQNLYREQSEESTPDTEEEFGSTAKEEPSAEMDMHIDGDKLKACVRSGGLTAEDLDAEQFSRLAELVGAFRHGQDDMDFEGDVDSIPPLEVVAQLLDYYLSPVI